METKHTPMPWIVTDERHDLIAIGAECRRFSCCVVNGPNPSSYADKAGIAQAAEQKANAEFIVRACNAHDELLEQLKAVTESLNMARLVMTDPQTRALAGEIVESARATITKVEGRS